MQISSNVAQIWTQYCEEKNMFNVLDFIDSKEIREYNRNTKFTPIEQAVLICHSMGTTVDEKMAAWMELL